GGGFRGGGGGRGCRPRWVPPRPPQPRRFGADTQVSPYANIGSTEFAGRRIRHLLHVVKELWRDHNAGQQRPNRLRMIGVGADGFVVERSQALFFLLGQRATPGAAGEFQAILDMPRASSRLRSNYGVVLTAHWDHVFAHILG